MRKKTKRHLKFIQEDINILEMKIVLAKSKVSDISLDLTRLKEEQLEILKKEAKCLNV